MSNQSTNRASSADEGDRANRARERRTRDEQLMSDARGGDAAAYRRLVDGWSANAFDRALHRGADERMAGEAVVRTFTQLQTELDGGEASFGARVMASVEQLVPSRPRALGKATRGAKRGAERLARGTDPAALGADPSISVMVWDALEVLGDRARDITDMHWRHGLASDEIAAATGESIFRVDDIIRKAPQGLAAALRTRLLWGGGKPDHDELTKDLQANNIRQFDSAAVRVIHAHLRGCSVCRSRSLIALPGVDIFAHIPIVALPGEVERRLSGMTWTPMQGGGAGDAAAGAAAGAVGGAAEPAEAASTTEALPGVAAEPSAPAATPGPSDPIPQPSQPVPAMASDTGTSLRERARNAARAGAAASSGAAAATAVSGAPAQASTMAPSASATSAEAASAPGLAPWTPPAETTPAPAEPATATTVMPTIAPAEPEPATSDAAGGRLEPVASQASERGDRPKWLVPVGVVAAAVVIIALIVVFTRGGGDKETAIDTGPSEQSTTTTRQPSSTTTTTRATTTSTAPPSTEAPSSSTPPPTTSGGGPAPTAPPTTQPPTIVANVQYQMKPGNVKIGKPSGDAGSFFTWSVSANGPVTVSVTGPGVSSGDSSGGLTVCAPAQTCGVGTHYFSIVVKDLDGRQVGAGTAKLVID